MPVVTAVYRVQAGLDDGYTSSDRAGVNLGEAVVYVGAYNASSYDYAAFARMLYDPGSSKPPPKQGSIREARLKLTKKQTTSAVRSIRYSLELSANPAALGGKGQLHPTTGRPRTTNVLYAPATWIHGDICIVNMTAQAQQLINLSTYEPGNPIMAFLHPETWGGTAPSMHRVGAYDGNPAEAMWFEIDYDEPPFQGSGSATAPDPTASGDGQTTNPEFGGVGSATAADPTAEGTGETSGPGYAGSGSATAPDPTASGDGQTTNPEFGGVGSATAADPTTEGTGDVPNDAYTGEGAVVVEDPTITGRGYVLGEQPEDMRTPLSELANAIALHMLGLLPPGRKPKEGGYAYYTVLASSALLADDTEAAIQMLLDWSPSRTQRLDLLELIGRERGIRRNPGEGLEAYRARVIAADEFWRWGGTVAGVMLALEVAGYAVAVTEHRETDKTRWAEFSLDLYPARTEYTTDVWDDSSGYWNDGSVWDWGLGLNEIDRVRHIIRETKAAHSKCRSVIYRHGSPLDHWDDGSAWDDGTLWHGIDPIRII